MFMITLIILVALMLLGVPVFFSMILSSAGLLITGNATFDEVAYFALTKTMNVSNVPIVLFVMTGLICFEGKLTERFFNIFAYFFGTKRSFRPVMCLLITIFFGFISPSATAVIALTTGMCLPVLICTGYNAGFSAAILMCTGVLSFLIPPSTSIRIAVGLANVMPDMGNLSGFTVGIAGAVLMLVYTLIYCDVTKDGDSALMEAHQEELYKKGFAVVFFEGLLALVLPVVIAGGILLHKFSSGRAAAFSVAYSIIVSTIFFRTLTFVECINVIKNGLKKVAPLLVILFAGNFLSACLEKLDAIKILSEYIRMAGQNKYFVTLIIFGSLFVLGMFMDSLDACYMLLPSVLPAAFMAGIEPYHLLTGLVGFESIGLITPPVGLALYTVLSISGIKFWEVFKNLIIPLSLLIILFLAFTLFPELTPFIK